METSYIAFDCTVLSLFKNGTCDSLWISSDPWNVMIVLNCYQFKSFDTNLYEQILSAQIMHFVAVVNISLKKELWLGFHELLF